MRAQSDTDDSHDEALPAALRDELERCRRSVADFSRLPDDRAGFARSGRPSSCLPIDRDRLPVVASVRLVMRLLVGAHRLGRAEKLAWEYPFAYRGRACSIAHEKFGLRLYLEPSSDPDRRSDGEEIVKKLRRPPDARQGPPEAGCSGGDSGRPPGGLEPAGRLRAMYQYFRRLATEAYAGNGFLARDHDEQARDTQFLRYFRAIRE